jgi:hypothetical protein
MPHTGGGHVSRTLPSLSFNEYSSHPIIEEGSDEQDIPID